MVVEVRWEVEDGYVGPSRTQYTKIEACEIDKEMTLDEVRDHIDLLVREDFEMNIAWNIGNLNEAAQELYNLAQERVE